MAEVVISSFLSNHFEHIMSASKEAVFHLINRNAKNKQNEGKPISDATNYCHSLNKWETEPNKLYTAA